MVRNMIDYLKARFRWMVDFFRFPKIDLRNLTTGQKKRLKNYILFGTMCADGALLAVAACYLIKPLLVVCLAYMAIFLWANLTDPEIN